MATLCDIVSRLPSAIVVIACLENYYEELRKLLTKPVMDRVENDPPPVGLQSLCGPDEVENLIGHRLKFLYDSLGVTYRADQPTFPLPGALVRELAGMRARDVLTRVQSYRERSVEKGKMAEFPFEPTPGVEWRSDSEVDVTNLAQQWNEFRSTFAPEVPVDDSELASIIARTISTCSDELEVSCSFESTVDGRMVSVDHHENGRLAGASWWAFATNARREAVWAGRSKKSSRKLVGALRSSCARPIIPVIPKPQWQDKSPS